MKKIILVLLTSLLSTTLFGDCPIISRWGERGITRDLAVNGSTLVAADGRGVAVYEVSNPAAIRKTGSMRTDAPSIAVERSGSSFVVLTSRGVELFDVDPANGAPRRLWTGEAVSASSLSCDGSLCATAGANLDIFRVEGAALRRTVTVPLGPAVNAIHVRDSHIFVGRGGLTTSVFDSNGTAIAELPFAGLAFASEGDRVFIAEGGSGVAVVDDTAPRRRGARESGVRLLPGGATDLSRLRVRGAKDELRRRGSRGPSRSASDEDLRLLRCVSGDP